VGVKKIGNISYPIVSGGGAHEYDRIITHSEHQTLNQVAKGMCIMATENVVEFYCPINVTAHPSSTFQETDNNPNGPCMKEPKPFKFAMNDSRP